VPDLHRSKRSSAWGPPDSRGPKFIKKSKNGSRITITRNTFNNMLIKLLIYFEYGAVGAPRGITVAWGLTRPKSGPRPAYTMSCSLHYCTLSLIKFKYFRMFPH